MAAQRASDYDPLSFVDVDVAPAGADGAASAAPPLDDDFADARSSMYASATPNAPHMHASATTSGGADAHMYASATSAASNTSHVSAMYQSATGTSTAAATGAPPAGGVDHRHSGSSRNDSNSSNNGNGGAYNGAYAPHGASPAGNGGGGSGGGASFTYPPSLPPPQQQSTLTPAPPQQQQQQQQRQGYPSVPPAGGSLHTSVDGGNAFAGGGLGFGGGFGGVGVGLGGVALAYSVTVGEPQKAVGATAIPGLGDGTRPTAIPGLGDGTYAAYPITSTRLGTGLGASGDSVQVLRRFKDVVALSDLLEDLFPGHFVPPRPRRNAVQGRRMQPGFLEARRAALERFLTRCACHPAVSSSEALSLFLTSHGDLRAAPAWQAMCGGASARGDGGHWRGAKTLLAGLFGPPPRASSGRPLRRLGERLAAARGTLRNMPVSPLEASLRSEGETLAGAQVSLVEAARCARAVSSATGAVADARAGLSRALNVLASYEADCGKQGHGNPGRAAAVVAQGCAKSAELSALAVQHSDAQLALLDDYACYLPNAAGAMSRREGALLMLVQLEADLSQRRAKLADAMDKPAMFAKRAGMQSAVATLEGAVHAARAEYDAVSQINAQELVALRASMRADLASALRQFVLIQVANNQKAAQLWEETLAALPLT
ncbi:hypothetical protein FOA52_003010 [Chlamydomonas sp. UWO 241]|nr:hypothetical protein FOA52_003010 [Chlamydomonas sp. UWO 241]